MLIYVLIVVGGLSGHASGMIVTFQEFTSRDKCEAAAQFILSKDKMLSRTPYAECFPK